MQTPVNAFKKAIAEKRTQYGLGQPDGPAQHRDLRGRRLRLAAAGREHTPNDLRTAAAGAGDRRLPA